MNWALITLFALILMGLGAVLHLMNRTVINPDDETDKEHFSIDVLADAVFEHINDEINADYAEMELRGLIAEAEEEGEETRYWRQGCVVYGDDTAEFEGESRQTIRFYMEMMKQEIITGGLNGEGEEVKAWKSFK